MKNYSKRCLWLVGGILLSSILCLVVSAVNVNIDISNAVQHINAVRLISNSENNEVIISKIGSNLVNVETNSNIIFGNENVIEESNENSTILGGSNNNVGKGKFSTIIAGLENNISGEGEGNTILGGYENNIKGQNSVIAGGKGNYIEGNASSIVGGENNNIMGNHSVTVGKNNSVTGNLSVAMGINSYVSGNNSFLWSDSTRSDVLEADNVFAIVSQNGMVVNSNTSNPNAKLTLGGSLVVASNDKDQDIVCEGGTGAGIVKAVLTGDQYCLCSCDGQGRNSMFGGGICKSICNGDTQPICGTGVSLIHSGSSYMFEGSCEQGNIVEGTGAYLLDKDNVLHWACQLGNGESVLCSSSDITPVYRSCELPWGGTIQHGEIVVAYENDKPAGTCASEQRHCNDGELEGSYRYNNCVDGCQKPWSDEYIPSGESLEAFKYNVVGFRDGYLCNLSQNRLCSNGVLDGEDDYKYNECKVEEPAKCFYNDRYYAHLAKLITYNKSEGKCPNEGCDRDMLESICYDGEWKKGGPEFWEEEGEIRMKVPLNDIPEGNPYQYAECKNTSDNDDYTLDRCPSMGSCDCKDVSIANNERPIPACESAHKCKLISCEAGYYKDGNSCTQCPTGYTSNVGATAQNQCFISCNDRYHIATPHASSCTSCANGTYKSGHNVNYGNTSSCVNCTNGPANSNYTTNGINNDCDWQCNAGYYKNGESCSQCPTDYTSNTGANSLSDCYQLPVCGSANGQTYTTQNNIPTSDRCTVGDYGSFSISSTGYASWTCSTGSNSVNCGATTWLSCGGTPPSLLQGVEKGSITHPYGSSPSSWQYVMWQNGSLGSCQWRCQNGYNKSGNGCIPIPQCGSLNGSGINNMGSTVNASNFIAGSLCSMGNPSNVSSANDCTGYTWTCTAGGSSVTCNAKRIYHATITGDNASMNSFDYGLVKVGDFCIMDRNLGANQVWDGTTTYSSYIGDVLGYFYNYGNNYGFSNSLTGGSSNYCYVNTDNHTWYLTLEDTRAACNCYNETGTFCYSNICETDQVFCVDRPWWYNDYETDLLYKLNTQQYFLWQKVNGLGLGLGAIYGDDQGFGVRGPCPEGYHIPTIYDRYQLSDYQNSQGEGFIPSLISLPVAGQFSPIGFNQNYYITYQPSYDKYWVSGQTDSCHMFFDGGSWNSTCAPVVDIGEMRSSNGNITTSKGIGLSNYLPIRCFKD